MLDECQLRAREIFRETWYNLFSELFVEKIQFTQSFECVLKRFGASATIPLVIMPFPPVPPDRVETVTGVPEATGRYFCAQEQLKPGYDLLFSKSLGISKTIAPGYAPGVGLWKALLDEVPAGFIRPLTTEEAAALGKGCDESIIRFLQQEKQWVGFEGGGGYALPLFMGRLPVYMVLLKYRVEEMSILRSLDLFVVLSMMQSTQRCISSILTPDIVGNILKLCVHKARLCDPMFSAMNLLMEAEQLRWTSWYQCIPGTGLEFLPETTVIHERYQDQWRKADDIRPEMMWETIAAQFAEVDFFAGKPDFVNEKAHEGWEDAYHSDKRNRIALCLNGINDNLEHFDYSGRYEYNLAHRLVRTTITLLRDANTCVEHQGTRTYPSFDRLKSLYCKSAGGSGHFRIYPLTLRTCVSLLLDEDSLFRTNCGRQLIAYVVGPNAPRECWRFLRLIQLLAESLDSISIVMPQPGTRSFSINLRMKRSFPGEGNDRNSILSILEHWHASSHELKDRRPLLDEGQVITITYEQDVVEIRVRASIGDERHE